MRHEQYAQRKRQLDEQLRAGIWMLQSGTGLAAPPAPVPDAAPREAVPPPDRAAPQVFLVDLVAEVREALPDLPERLTGADVGAALGWQPERTGLYRALRQLVMDGDAVLDTRGSGRHLSVYRKAGV